MADKLPFKLIGVRLKNGFFLDPFLPKQPTNKLLLFRIEKTFFTIETIIHSPSEMADQMIFER